MQFNQNSDRNGQISNHCWRNYKIIFFDAYGVIKNYKGLIPGIEKTFDWLNEQQKAYYVITNDASRSPELLAESYHKSGLHAITADNIISSGMLAKEFLDLKVKKGLVAYLERKILRIILNIRVWIRFLCSK